MTSPPANANGHRRRQVRARVLAEETTCAICGEPVDKSLTVVWLSHGPKCTDPSCAGCTPHPMRAEVDEIIERRNGGSPTSRANTRLTHRVCNQQRGKRAGAVRAVPFTTLVQW